MKANCTTTVAAIADASGKLCRDNLQINRQSFKEALDKGLNWFIMHWQCPAVWPELPHFVQAAPNTHAKSACSEVEVMLEMAAMSAAQGPEVPWKSIQEAACFSMPPCAPWVSSLAAYLRANAGGPNAELLQELSLFSKAFACSDSGPNRTLGREFMNRLTALADGFGPGVRFPYIINGCIKAQLASPRIVDGMCKLLTPSLLSLLAAAKNREVVKEAESLMADARGLCTRMGASEADSVRCVGKLDVRCILHITNKGKESEGKSFDNIPAIAKA